MHSLAFVLGGHHHDLLDEESNNGRNKKVIEEYKDGIHFIQFLFDRIKILI